MQSYKKVGTTQKFSSFFLRANDNKVYFLRHQNKMRLTKHKKSPTFLDCRTS